MRIIVTGGTGFIGSNFVQSICNQPRLKYTPVVLAKRTGVSTCASLKHCMSQITVDELDLQNYAKLCHQIVDADIVVHFAAESHVTKSIENPGPFIDTNIKGTMNILNACMDMNVKLIYISSCEVYGEAGEASEQTEDAPLHPMSPYAASKGGADLLCQSYIYTYKLPVVIIRPVNNYGPWQHPEKVVPKFIEAALKGEDITLHGDGRQSREWIYVNDCCKAILQATKLDSGVYNIGTGEVITVKEIAETIIELTGSTSNIRETPDRPGQVSVFRLNSSKFRAATEWAPAFDFKQGISNTIEWYKKTSGS